MKKRPGECANTPRAGPPERTETVNMSNVVEPADSRHRESAAAPAAQPRRLWFAWREHPRAGVVEVAS